MRKIFILLTCFCTISFVVYGQTELCGFKTSCECADSISNELIDNSDLIFEGIVIAIDTLPLSNIVTKQALKKLRADTQDFSNCAKNIIDRANVLVVTVKADKFHKGEKRNKIIKICTPIEQKLCGYQYFKIGEPYIIYNTIDTTADIYYTYCLYDYFILKSDYQYWTNYCMQTKKLPFKHRN